MNDLDFSILKARYLTILIDTKFYGQACLFMTFDHIKGVKSEGFFLFFVVCL